MAAKLKDIVERVNLSPTTVSMVLNGKDIRVSEETKKLIKDVAKELDYRPNRMAVSLVTRKSMNIGLIVPDIENSFFAELAKHVGNYLKTKGYNLLLCNTNNNIEDDIRFIKMFRANAVDGVIGVFSETGNEEYSEELSKMLSGNISVVMMDKIVSGLKTPCVGTDNFYGGYVAMKHLISHGHKKIAIVSGPLDSVSGKKRLEGAKKALEDEGLAFDEKELYVGDYQYDSGYRAGRMIAQKKEISAVFACNDMMAYGVYKAAQEAGLSIGKELSLVGFDDLLFSSMLEVPLTTVRQNVKEIAERASDILLNSIDGKETKELGGLTLPELIERNSVANFKKMQQ